jgi:transposase
MPRACSADLRERVLAAYEAGEGSQAEVARRFRIGGRTLSRWLQAARTEGRRGPKVPGRRRAPLGGQAAALAELVAEQGDATLSEYAERLAARTGVRRSLAAVCRALKALGLVRKKRRSEPPSRTARTSPRRGPHGAPNWQGSTRAGSSSSTRPGSTPA